MFRNIARIVKKISFMILSWQSLFLQKRLEKRFGYSKKNIIDGCTLNLSQKQKTQRDEIDLEVMGILKQLNNNQEKIIEYLEHNNIKIFSLKNADKLLKHIKENSGFIAERNGYKALCINLFVGNGFKFKSKPMIIFSKEIDIYYLIRALYCWYSYKKELPGFDKKAQTLLYRLQNENGDKFISKLSVNEIDILKNAIKRNVHAIEFVTKYTKETVGAKNVLKKMQDEGGAKI